MRQNNEAGEVERQGGREVQGPRIGERATGSERRRTEKVGISKRERRKKLSLFREIYPKRWEGEGKQQTGRKGRESWVERGGGLKKSFLVARSR